MSGHRRYHQITKKNIFFEVPTKSQYISNHHVQSVMAELFKGVNNLMDSFLIIKDNHYNLRSFQ